MDEPDEYGRIAPVYDPATALFLDPGRRAVIRLLLARGAKRVLDVCCGTGRQLAMLAGAGVVGEGVDLSPAMLAKARRNCPPGAVLRRMDATRLAYPDGAFDACIVTFALHEKPAGTRRTILHEALRVVSPHGAVLVTDYVLPRGAARLTCPAARLAEWSAGREHYANFTQFMGSGASEGLFARAGVAAEKANALLFGCAGLFLVYPNPTPLAA